MQLPESAGKHDKVKGVDLVTTSERSPLLFLKAVYHFAAPRSVIDNATPMKMQKNQSLAVKCLLIPGSLANESCMFCSHGARTAAYFPRLAFPCARRTHDEHAVSDLEELLELYHLRVEEINAARRRLSMFTFSMPRRETGV